MSETKESIEQLIQQAKESVAELRNEKRWGVLCSPMATVASALEAVMLVIVALPRVPEVEENKDEGADAGHLSPTVDDLKTVSPPLAQWQPIETIPKDGTTFWAYSPELVHPDFNPRGVVECVFDGEKFIGAVWDGQFDCWNTVAVTPTLWMPIPDSPSYSKERGSQ